MIKDFSYFPLPKRNPKNSCNPFHPHMFNIPQRGHKFYSHNENPFNLLKNLMNWLLIFINIGDSVHWVMLVNLFM